MDPFFETIDIQKTREILDTLAEEFDELSEEATALNMATLALFDGGAEKLKRIYDEEQAARRTSNEETDT